VGETLVLAFGPRASERPPLLLLHGTLSNSCMWMGDMATYAQGRRVYAIDIPGEPGLSAETSLDWQGKGAALWLGEVAAALGLGRFDLCGLSIGGWIALSYAIGRPAELRSLILLAPSGIGRTKPSFIFKALLQMPRGEEGYRAIATSLYGDFEPPEGALEAGMEFSRATNPRQESPRIFTNEELAGIQARLFMAVGSKDPMLHSRESRRRLARAKPEAEIFYLHGAGHALLGLAPLVVGFLGREAP
jgi:pimeloyl-ACP methyl ester carboxylesterase